MAPTAGAAAIVFADGRPRGSAFLITPGLALTTSFIVFDQTGGGEAKQVNHIQVRPMGTDSRQECEVIWANDAAPTHAALLRIGATGDHEKFGLIDSCAFGRLVGPGARRCEAIGFTPSWGEDHGESPEATRILGMVDPASWPESHYLLFETSRHSRLSGAGGAGVCCEGHLVGLLEMFNPTDGSFRVIPLAELLRDRGFTEVLKREIGFIPEVQDVLPPDTGITATLKDLSKADPSNIQEVAASQFALSNLYYENVLAQARRSFNAAAIASVAGLAFFMAAIGFAMSTHQLAAPVVSAVSGGIVEVVGGLNFWLYGRTSSQLNSFHLRLERMQRFLLANSVAAGLRDDHREVALSELIKAISTASQVIDPISAHSKD